MRRRLLFGLVPLGVAAGCGGGGAAARPNAEAVSAEPRCEAVRDQLAVGWTQDDRVELQALARQGVVVVRVDGCRVEVLRDCRAPGKYAHAPTRPEQDEVTFRKPSELDARMPRRDPSVDRALSQRGAVVLRAVLGGRLEATAPTTRAELSGSCQGATHYVGSFALGAFSLDAAGPDRSVMPRPAVQNPDHLAGAGDPSRCQDGGTTPLFGCDELVRIELVPLGEPPRGAAAVALLGTPPESCSPADGPGRCVALGLPEVGPYAELRVGEGAARKGDRKEAVRLFDAAVALHAESPSPETAEGAARAELGLAEFLAADAAAATLDANALTQSLRELTERSSKATGAFERVVARGRVWPSLRALFGKGQVLEGLASKIRAAPVPDSIAKDAEMRAAYQATLEEQLVAIEVRARQAYEQLLALAEQNGVTDAVVSHGRERLEALRARR